jgi:6-pyruvoyl-tetrahydropterin synthase
MTIRVRAHFCASHRGMFAKQTHGHSWHVYASFQGGPERNAEVLQQTLQGLLRGWDHRTLDEMFGDDVTDEKVAGFILHQLSDRGCVRVELDRPVEGISVAVGEPC